jgi:dihydroorotate dehydrogenase electron transfer subunit
MVQTKAEIISNAQVAPGHFKMVLESPEIAQEAQPGQFVHVRVHEGLEPLLRRPFSIHRVEHQSTRAPGTRHQIEILYKIRGKATEILSTRKAGEELDIIGPLGNGFPLPEHQSTRAPGTSILVAGGIGVAPLVFLAEKLTHRSPLTAHRKPIVLIGAKTKDLILCANEFKELGCEVKVATEDGSLGFKGLVTDLLRDLLSATRYPLPAILYAAGPIFMLQEIKKIANMFKILSFGSLEENIACGLGGCFGCAVKTGQGYQRVCREGPVFNLEEVVWE